MRVGTVIGRVVLCAQHKSYVGGRFMLTLPWKAETYDGAKAYDPSIVVYDELGASAGQEIGISEGAEASRPFEPGKPVDAYCAVLIDEMFYQKEEPQRAAKAA